MVLHLTIIITLPAFDILKNHPLNSCISDSFSERDGAIIFLSWNLLSLFAYHSFNILNHFNNIFVKVILLLVHNTSVKNNSLSTPGISEFN